MKKIIIISFVVFILSIVSATACMAPIKPILPIKPIWCQGIWTQQLQCDGMCNCSWVPVCIQQ